MGFEKFIQAFLVPIWSACSAGILNSKLIRIYFAFKGLKQAEVLRYTFGYCQSQQDMIYHWLLGDIMGWSTSFHQDLHCWQVASINLTNKFCNLLQSVPSWHNVYLPGPASTYSWQAFERQLVGRSVGRSVSWSVRWLGRSVVTKLLSS